MHFAVLATFGALGPSMMVVAAFLLLAGGLAAYLAPRMKLLVGAGVAVPAALLMGIGDAIFGSLGNYPYWPGPANSLLLAIVVFPAGLLLCSAGAWIGARYSMAKPRGVTP